MAFNIYLLVYEYNYIMTFLFVDVICFFFFNTCFFFIGRVESGPDLAEDGFIEIGPSLEDEEPIDDVC